MSTTLIDGIGSLYTGDPEREEIPDAALVVADGLVAWAGPAAQAPDADERVDVGGRAVIPGFVDSHAHLIFAGDRTAEFQARMSGEPYTGGGIRTTVAATRQAGDAELAAHARALVAEMLAQGTTTVEIKSGYGLTVEDERRSLEIAAGLTGETTFLGAHVVPAGMDADSYVRLVAGEMLDACAPHARWIDVFCERGAFDGDQPHVGVGVHAGGHDVRPQEGGLAGQPGGAR
ncbi:imidazolonepropionase, partial [Nonomuraea angiospora]|nr:imidazolonepropionase [Nonomuraea angiospora]